MAETKNNQAVIKMMDTGKRIDVEMISRLFSKFATRYERGTASDFYLKGLPKLIRARYWLKTTKKDGS